MSVTWEQALTDIEARLDALDQAFDSGDAAELEFAPPDVDGPLPLALRDRAEAAATRTDALRARAEARTKDIKAELQRLPRRRSHSATTSLFEIGV
jgi:hypothetical protein